MVIAELHRYRVVEARSRIWAELQATLTTVTVEASEVVGDMVFAVRNGRVVALPSPKGHFEVDAGELRGANRLMELDMSRALETRKFQRIVGEVSEFEGDERDSYRVAGQLQLHGVRQRVEGRVEIEFPDERHIRLRGSATIDLLDFGVRPPNLLVLKVKPLTTFFGDIVGEVVS